MLVAGLFGIIWAPVWGACVRCFGVVSGVGGCGDVVGCWGSLGWAPGRPENNEIISRIIYIFILNQLNHQHQQFCLT